MAWVDGALLRRFLASLHVGHNASLSSLDYQVCTALALLLLLRVTVLIGVRY